MSFADIPISSQSAPILEFEVLWTTQKHQKNKKWHDGVLRFHTFNKRLMCSKFHAVQTNIEVGDELVFENHLVTVEEVKGQTEQNLRPLFEKTVERRQARGDASSPPGSHMDPMSPTVPPIRPSAAKNAGPLTLSRGGSRRLGLTRSASAVIPMGLGRGRGGVVAQQKQQQQSPRMPPPPIPRTPAAQQRQAPPNNNTTTVSASKTAVSAFKPPIIPAVRPPQIQQQQQQHRQQHQRQQPQRRTADVPIKGSPSSVPVKQSPASMRTPVIKESPASTRVSIKDSPASTRDDVVDIPSSDDDGDENEMDEDLARMAAVERTVRKNQRRREAQVESARKARQREHSSPAPQQPTSSIPSKRGHESTEEEDEDMDDVTAVIDKPQKKSKAPKPRKNVQVRDVSSSPTPQQAPELVAPEAEDSPNDELEEPRHEPEPAGRTVQPGLLYLQSAAAKEPRKMLLCQPRKKTSLSTRGISDLGMRKLSMEDEDKEEEEEEERPTTTRNPPKAQKTTTKKAATTKQTTKKPPAKRAAKKATAAAAEAQEPEEDSEMEDAEVTPKPAPRARKKRKENPVNDPKGKKPEPLRHRGKSLEAIELLSDDDQSKSNEQPGRYEEDEDLAEALFQSSPYLGTNVFNEIESTAQAMHRPTPPPIPEEDEEAQEEEEEEEDPYADLPQVGPWTIEAYDLLDWRPPGREGFLL